MKKGSEMDYERNSKCWYKEVCSQDCRGCIRYAEMQSLVESSGIPAARMYPQQLIAGNDYAEFCKLADIKDNIEQFVKEGNNLYIGSSQTGNGKTSWAIKLLLKYFDCIWAGNGFRTSGLFVHVPTLLLQMKNFSAPLSEEYKYNLINSPLVVFDDIGCGNISAYDFSNLMMIIDGRLMNKRSNIFTSNQPSKQALENMLGDRLASRIWESSTVVILKGKDRRNGSATDNQ